MIVWVADTLRAAGLKVHEVPGWKTRQTRPGFTPQGIICHHTATGPNVSDQATETLLVAGRPDLSGPLSQLGLRRDGTWVCVAAGRANHNGYGTWGNDSIGVEAYNDGVGEPWPQAQYGAYAGGVAAICRRLGWGVDRVLGHKESDPGRKIDPTFDMNRFRADVNRYLHPKPKPKPKKEIDVIIVTCKGQATRLLDSPSFAPIDAATQKNLTAKGVPVVPYSRYSYDWQLRHCSEALGRDIVKAIET